LKAGTPFETASTPVIALHPSAKAHEQEDAQSLGRDGHRSDPRHLGRVAEQRPPDADGDERQHGDEEDIGRNGEHAPAFADASHVDEHHRQDAGGRDRDPDVR
jgi:hypothetical protein